MSVMDQKTMEALEGSIEKWQKIVDGTGRDESISNCPLCIEFFKNGCRGCPVYRKTEVAICRDTPYDDWSKVPLDLPYNDRNGYTHTRASLRAAKAELKFLKSLLPARHNALTEG